MLTLIAIAFAEESATDLGGTSLPPAFLLVGADPDGVETPSTPSDVAIALGNIVPEGTPGLPSGVALEVAPFWLGPNPTTVREYVGGGPWTILRNIRISAVAETDGDAWTGALGVRTTIWGKAPKDTEARRFVDDYTHIVEAKTPESRKAAEAAVESSCGRTLVALAELSRTLSENLDAARATLDETMRKTEDEIDAVCANPALKGMGESAGWCREMGFTPDGSGAASELPATKDDAVLAWLEKKGTVLSATQEELDKLRAKAGATALGGGATAPESADGPKGKAPVKFDQTRLAGCSALLDDPRRGLVVEVGGAYGATSPDATYGAFGPAGFGAYAVGTYFFGRPAISLMGRVIGGGTEATEGDTQLEGGGGLVYSVRKVDVGVSGLFAYGLAAQDIRADVLARFNYRVTPTLWLVSSFGARLPFMEIDETSVLSQLSLHFNFGENRPTQAEMLDFADLGEE